jgi:hypothetical protein
MEGQGLPDRVGDVSRIGHHLAPREAKDAPSRVLQEDIAPGVMHEPGSRPVDADRTEIEKRACDGGHAEPVDPPDVRVGQPGRPVDRIAARRRLGPWTVSSTYAPADARRSQSAAADR